MASHGFLGIGGDSWREEVLLHDGSKIVVRRSQNYGGRHEIGQPAPIREHTIRFNLPGSHQGVEWTSEYGEELGRTNFNLLAIHVLHDTPYIVASPNLCLSYNKWGRPNPPYVFFKFNGTTWQRISLEEFPQELTTVNVALSIRGRDLEKLCEEGLVPAEKIKKLNEQTKIVEYKTILREPKKPEDLCPEEIRIQDGWLSISAFSRQSSYEACMKVCDREGVSPKNCPCERLFNQTHKGR
ncbi:MAG: hypothetical protein BWK76_11305 [Desulfobulbaceae bacterium A2]|nr:MAG: hypothetical protein BWK76_11305 [Desulfobulbaceae bacterium A2]